MSIHSPTRSTTTSLGHLKTNFLSSYLISDDEEEGESSGSSAEARLEILAAPPPLLVAHKSSKLEEENSGSEGSLARSSQVWADDTIGSQTPCRAQYRIAFEIIKARTVTTNERHRYVNYTILVKRVPGLETKPALIERRYTDFLRFYNALKKRYYDIVKNIEFPRKILLRNFSTEVIAARSAAFQKFLTTCLGEANIRSSHEFATFLYHPELNEAKKCLQAVQLEEAANILENVYFIQEKLFILSDSPSVQLIHTLCALVGCLNALDNKVEAKKLTSNTFDILFQHPVIRVANNTSTVYEVNNVFESSELVLPLIQLSLKHYWFTGQKKSLLESKLDEFRRKHTSRRMDKTLLEVLMRPDFSLIVD